MRGTGVKIPIWVVDAFTDEVFKGNPAAVCLLDGWLPDSVLQNIAFENNLSETAFVVGSKSHYELRWFTPTMEVDLCGHATLAAAHVLRRFITFSDEEIRFLTKSGLLTVAYEGDFISMVFPRRLAVPCLVPDRLISGLGVHPLEVLKSRDYLIVLDNEQDLRALQPVMDDLRGLDCLGVIVTAKGSDVDFVSRFFAPAAGVNEDPVTGSAHSTLIPYWATRLKKRHLSAKQVSSRGGLLRCEDMDEAVKIAGQAAEYLVGEIGI
jgi:predicted PhzF superfamily epimerase YddE/YHI9